MQRVWAKRRHAGRFGSLLLNRTFLEVHDWQQYAEMLSQWARSIDTFETTVKRISELPELVYFESKSDTSEINVPTS